MDEQQFKNKVIPLSNRLYSICISVLGSKHDAKDCLQDVFIKLWNRKEVLSKVKSIEAYATTITRNQCLDRLRLKKNTLQIELAVDQIEIQPELTTDEDTKLNLINKALTYLNPIQQRIFTMRDIECKEFNEIAKELETSHENIRMTLSRARKRIREIIEDNIKGKL